MAMAELDRRHRAISAAPSVDVEMCLLTQFELRVFSQNGEDGVLAEILRRIGVGEQRYFVEFGVESGREGNCVYLADIAGWRGLFMDGDERFFTALQQKYRASELVHTTNAMVMPENVQELFAAAEVPSEPDVLSIDVDGTDYWIWEAIKDYRPRVVVVEYNSALDPRRRLVQPADYEVGWDGTDYFGASLAAMRSLGERKGYRLVQPTLWCQRVLCARGSCRGPDARCRGIRCAACQTTFSAEFVILRTSAAALPRPRFGRAGQHRSRVIVRRGTCVHLEALHR